MKTKSDIQLAICIISFGLPIILLGRKQWELGLVGTLIFLLLYLLLPFSRNIRSNIKFLDIFVYGSYTFILLGCWFFYINGYSQSMSFWLYLLISASGFPIFKQLEKYFIDKK